MSLVVATLGLVAMLGALRLHMARAGTAPGDVIAALPPLWLWAAAILNRTETGHAAYAVTTAGLFNLLLSVGLLSLEYQLWATKLPTLVWTSADKVLILPQFPIALTALVPAAVGWWQRRRERLADEADTD